VERGGDS
jgi:hypothetical protein